MRLSITTSADGSVQYLRIRGDVDLSDLRELDLAAQCVIAANAGLVYIDLGGITFMGSTLVGFMVHLTESGVTECSGERRRLILCRPTPMARRVIRLTRLDELASVRSDLPSWPDDISLPTGELAEATAVSG